MYRKLYDVLNNKEENYMLPFYWQHGDHHESIPQEIRRIYDSGCRAFCVESRPHKDFVGEGWWRDMDLILSEAKKRDMKVWILDDDHFPTGNAVGKIKECYPDKQRWDLGERHVDVQGPTNQSLLLTMENESSRLLGVYAYKRTGEKENCALESVIDLSARVKDGFCEVSLPEGLWRVFFIYKTRKNQLKPFYVDMLSKDAVKVLIDTVYEPHFAHYREYFGNTISGFFSDEPSFCNSWFSQHSGDPGMYRTHLGLPGMAYPWSPAVFEDIKKHTGLDPLPHMAALWFDMGEQTPFIRYAYMDAITRLYRDNFTRQLGDWCTAHGVEYIGHIIEDMGTHKRTGRGPGHYFRSLDGQHMSGVDIVLHQLMPGMNDSIHTASTYGNNADPAFFNYVLIKLAASLAHIGKDMKGRAMCEVFGAYGWAESGSDMKWLLDHLLVRGVNHFVPHAFSPAFPDPDCPPHFGAAGKDPQFEAFGRLMRYGNKATHLLYGGEHIADAAILYDAEIEWMSKDGLMDSMQIPAKLLYDKQIDFDFLPADCLTGAEDARIFPAETENGALKVGHKNYRVLIIPAYHTLPTNLEKSLLQLQKAGVPVLRMGIDCTEGDLCTKVSSLFTPDIVVEGKAAFLRACHYVDGANDVYMFVNESTTEGVDCTLTLHRAQSDKGVCLDLLNDVVYRAELRDKALPLTLSPNHSCIFVFGDVDADAFPEKTLWKKREKAMLTFKIETAPAEDMQHFTLLEDKVEADKLFSITALERSPDFAGKIRYTAHFDSSILPQGEHIALDLGSVGSVSRLFLNGEDLGLRLTFPYLYDLSHKIKEGTNELVIEVSNTLAGKLKDRFSAFMAIPAAGLTEQPCFVTP